MTKCSKCKTDCKKEGQFFVQGGESKYFCAYCSAVLEETGTGNVDNFLNDEELSMIDNPILKNIIRARIRRSAHE